MSPGSTVESGDPISAKNVIRRYDVFIVLVVAPNESFQRHPETRRVPFSKPGRERGLGGLQMPVGAPLRGALAQATASGGGNLTGFSPFGWLN